MPGVTSAENEAREHLQRILKAPGKAWLVVDPAGLVGRLGPEALSSGPDSFFYGTAETEIHEPYGPFAQIAGALSAMLARTEPEIVRRYSDTLWNLQRIRPWPTGMRPGSAFRSSLADHVLRGNARRLRDFFQGRNVSPRFTEDIVHFLIDAAHSRSDEAPLVVLIENVEELDPQAAALARMVIRHLAGHSLCLVLTTGGASVPWLEDLVAAGEVESLEMPKPQGHGADDESPLLQITARSRSVLEACAVLCRPSHADDLLRLVPERSEEIHVALADLAGQHLVVLLDDGYVAVPRVVRHELSKDPAGAERRRELHDRAQKTLTKEDPFRSAHHAWEAGSKEAPLTSLAAMEQAWAVSAYGCAEAHAHRALVEGKATVQVDSALVFALLYYEAGRFEDSDRCFAEALERAAGEETVQHLVWLRSYATIFGLHQYEKGLQPLRLLAESLESKGRLRDNLWVLNTLAFALFHLGRHQEAMAVEELALEKATHLSTPERFLLTILNLNLGRLHRLGSLSAAEELLRRSLEQGRGEMDPFFLLLFYATFARLHVDSGSPREALLWYRRCEEIMMDVDVAGFLGRVFPLLAKDFKKQFGLLDFERLPRGEQAKLFLSFNMSLLFAAIGDESSAGKRMAWVRHRLEGTGYGGIAAKLAALLEGTERTAGIDSGATGDDLAPSPSLGSLEFVGSPLEAQPSEAAAQALSEGRSVAWVRGRFAPSPVEDSLVFYDPASAPLRSALCADLSLSESEGGVLLLPAGRDLFDHVEDFPGVIQIGTLRRDLRQRWPGAQPIRTRVLLLDPDHGELFLLLSRFFQKTGTPMLGVFSFRLLGEDTATTGELASKYFLETGVDCLVLGDTWTEKRPGISTSSLRNLRPRVSGVLIPQQEPGSSEARGLLFSKGCYSKISPAGFRLLERCSGQRSVYELASDLGAAGREEEVCSFLLQLRRKGAVHFVRE